MKTLLIAEANHNLRRVIRDRLRACEVPIEHILEYQNEDMAIEHLRTFSVDVLLADVRMNRLWEARKAGLSSGGQPVTVMLGPPVDFSCVVEMMRCGVRDYLTVPLEPGQLEKRMLLLEQEIQNRSWYFEKGNRVFCAQLRHFLLNPEEMEEELLDDIGFFFREILNIRGSYRAVIACPETGPLPVSPEVMMEHMEGGTLYLFSSPRAEKLMTPDSGEYYLGISREYSSIRELYKAYREAVDARKVAYVSCRSWEEYEEYSFEENPSLPLWKERYLYEFSIDRLEMVEKKPQQWFFEARHRRLSPFQLLRVMTELCRELDRFSGETEENEPAIPACPLPEECPNAEIFLKRFDQWSEECRESFYHRSVSPQNMMKIRKAMDFIRNNYQKDLNMAMVSNYVSMNYSMFSHEFKKYSGMNFVSYLKEVRLRMAKRLLEETDQKVADIGAAVGYENDKHFLKSFRNFCGLTPSEYRRSVDAERKFGDEDEEM